MPQMYLIDVIHLSWLQYIVISRDFIMTCYN